MLAMLFTFSVFSQDNYSTMYDSRFYENEQISCKTKIELKDKWSKITITSYETMKTFSLTRTSKFYDLKTKEGLSYRGAILTADGDGTKFVMQIFEDENYGIRFVSEKETVQYLGKVW